MSRQLHCWQDKTGDRAGEEFTGSKGITYTEFFQRLTGFSPYPWQRSFNAWDGSRVAVVSAPTGSGKEAGVTIPWLYGHACGAPVPRRLLYGLPTRSLVDQVEDHIQQFVQASGLNIPVYCLKGGLIEHGYEAALTRRAIIVGTQDQLLTRALNRGYGVPWSQRPKHAAAFNNDCRWILDETQLMGVGYPTAVQLHQLRQQLGTYGPAQLALLSATMDLQPLLEFDCVYERFGLSDADYQHSYLGAKLRKAKPLHRVLLTDESTIATLALANHRPGTLTLVVLNTVAKVRAVGECLRRSGFPVLILHARLLGWKRSQLQQQLYHFQGMVVATQVVEAGVDLDARVLITDLCPWSSFKQRVGRCGRTNLEQEALVFWLEPIALEDDRPFSCKPYNEAECRWTAEQLAQLDDVGLLSLESIQAPSPPMAAEGLGVAELNLFFNTHPFSPHPPFSVSACVRDTTRLTCYVCWSAAPPVALPHQEALCPVPLLELQPWVVAHALSPQVWEQGWTSRSRLAPGDIVWLPLEAGGYDDELGWTGKATDWPTLYPIRVVTAEVEDPPFPHWVTLDVHSGDAASYLESYRPTLACWMSASEIDELVTCARWHDWGKAALPWQQYAQAAELGTIVAKSPRYGHPRQLKGYRHELASAIAAGQQGASFLAQYLIAAHHGQVRECLEDHQGLLQRQAPRGVVLGSTLPPCTLGGQAMPATLLMFKPDDWKPQVRQLLQRWGAFKLWYLETVIRNADVEASRWRQAEAKTMALNAARITREVSDAIP